MSNTRDLSDYYRTLGITSDATGEQIKKAYHKLALLWHPDKHSGKSTYAEAESKFKLIAKAYEELGNEENKSVYGLKKEYTNFQPHQKPQKKDHPKKKAQTGSGNFFHKSHEKPPASKAQNPSETSSSMPESKFTSSGSKFKFKFSAKAPEFVPGRMHEVQNIFDLAVFAGNIICFEAKDCEHLDYLILGKKFAYVDKDVISWSDGIQTVGFSILYKSEFKYPNFQLGGEQAGSIKVLSLKASIATPEEINLIKEALRTEVAQFATRHDSNLTEILNGKSATNHPFSDTFPRRAGGSTRF